MTTLPFRFTFKDENPSPSMHLLTKGLLVPVRLWLSLPLLTYQWGFYVIFIEVNSAITLTLMREFHEKCFAYIFRSYLDAERAICQIIYIV